MRAPFVVILCLAYFCRVHGDQPITYKATNLECKIHFKYGVNTSCLVKAKNWNKAVVNMECDLVLPLRNISIRMELFKKGYNNRHYPFLINVDVNMCDIIARRSYIPYGTIFWKMVKEYSNVNHSCPYSGHLMARNMYLEANQSHIPPLPLGFYLATFEVFENFRDRPREHVGLVKYYFQTAEVVQLKNRKN